MLETIDLIDGADSFKVFTPNAVDLLEKSSGPEAHERPIGGYCSTQRRDRQEEVVLAKGLDFSEFLSCGFFNDNHKQDTHDALGWPDSVVLKSNRWYTKGYLVPGYTPSDKIWELAKALKKSNAPRRLGFSIEGKVIERGLDNRILKAKIRHVAITNCFPGDVQVNGSAESVTRRWYSGPFVEIVLASGEKLSGTPNHPVLTQRGWIALGDLDERHDRVGCSGSDAMRIASGVSHDVEHVPTKLEQLFDLACDLGVDFRVRRGRESDFHGDGCRSDVHVVAMNSFLKRNLDTAFFKHFGENVLPASDKETEFLSRHSSRVLDSQTVFLPTPGVMRLSQRGELSALLSGVREAQALPFLVGPSGDAFASSHLNHTLARDTKTLSNGERSLSRAISFSNLTGKRSFNFSGHVFNLDTSYGWYDANGIIAHNSPVNTDCTWTVLTKAMSAPDEMDAFSARKALSVGHQNPASTAGAALRSESVGEGDGKDIVNLTFDAAVKQVKKAHPAWSWGACERTIRLVFRLEERKQQRGY